MLPLLNVGYEAATYSAGLIAIIARFVVGRDGLTPAEVDAWVATCAGSAPDYFFSLNRYVFRATRSA